MDCLEGLQLLVDNTVDSRREFCEKGGLSVGEIEYNERQKKRDKLGTSKESVMFVDTDMKSAIIRVMNPESERCYITRTKDLNRAAYLIPVLSHKYKVKQVFIGANGFGIAVANHLRHVDVADIDIIPMIALSSSIDRTLL